MRERERDKSLWQKHQLHSVMAEETSTISAKRLLFTKNFFERRGARRANESV